MSLHHNCRSFLMHITISLEEMAKFSAARRMWARIMKTRFKSKKDKSQMLRFHTQTAGSSLTAQQPENNVVRVTMQALSAVLGGTQSLHTNSMDEALWLPTEKSVRVALTNSTNHCAMNPVLRIRLILWPVRI